MSTWRAAQSLAVLFRQLNEAYPARSRLSDGTVCNPDNHTPSSDHCPHDFPGWGSDIVTAGDYTHDSGHGCDMAEVSEAIRQSRDRRVKYVIFNRRIFSATVSPWQWRPYSGLNPHDRHMHLSVVGASAADDIAEWKTTMALTDDDISRVAAATATKVLGRAFLNPQRTLAGSVEALLNYHPQVMAVLKEIRDDPDNTFSPTNAELQLIADRLATRLPTDGTFQLTPRASQ